MATYVATYLERYLAGEHEQVWVELVSLGERVREEPLYSDAWAVARETMRRARRNIELLVERLPALGYRFGYDWLAEQRGTEFGPEAIREIERDAPHFRPPRSDVAERIAELEARAGALPLALRAWYEVVGTVDFVGKAPTTWDDLGYQGFRGEAYRQFVREHPTYTPAEYRQFSKEHPEFRRGIAAEDIYLDPLVVYPIEITLQLLDYRDEADQDKEGRWLLHLAPDWNFKYFVSGAGAYEVRVPCLAADAPLEGEWHDVTFVEYLRVCFRWGGFPGLLCAPHPPADDVALLTRELLPL